MPGTRVRIYSRWYHLFLAYGEAAVNLNALPGGSAIAACQYRGIPL